MYDCLYPGSQFNGTQRSSTQNYSVNVVIQHVDLDNSTFSGYLSILGLAEKYLKLTTFFEAEIIGDEYSFLTRKWETTERTDIDHWFRFPQFSEYKDTFNRDGFSEDFSQKDFLFMRWKEQFLVPDHTVVHVDGASYDGFYYMCFQKSKGVFEGFYFHKSSEKYQKIEMKHQPDKTFPSFNLM